MFTFVQVVQVLRLCHRWLMFLWIPIDQVGEVSRWLDVDCGTVSLGDKQSEMVLDLQWQVVCLQGQSISCREVVRYWHIWRSNIFFFFFNLVAKPPGHWPYYGIYQKYSNMIWSVLMDKTSIWANMNDTQILAQILCWQVLCLIYNFSVMQSKKEFWYWVWKV